MVMTAKRVLASLLVFALSVSFTMLGVVYAITTSKLHQNMVWWMNLTNAFSVSLWTVCCFIVAGRMFFDLWRNDNDKCFFRD